MPLRVAFDLDGTLADMEGALQREAEQLFGPHVVVRPPGSEHLEAPTEGADTASEGVSNSPAVDEQAHRKHVLNSRKRYELWQHVARIDNFWTTLKEIEPGSVARIAATREKYQLEVIFLTQRPATDGELVQLQTQRWLDAHGFELPAVFVLRGSRGLAAAALQLDVVVDDRPANCVDVATESKARPFLIWRDPVERFPAGATRLGIEPVASVADALQRIEAMLTDRSKSTLVSRLRNAMGI